MKTFFFTDPHFHHRNILTFRDQQGKLIRPEFTTVEEMNRQIVDQWNSAITPDDRVYLLGDVAMSTSAWAFEIVGELNGRKILIKGNHDNAKLAIYSRYFADIRSEIQMKMPEGDRVLFTHRPITLPDLGVSEEEAYALVFNVHGHTHQRSLSDCRYINICPEIIGYTPIEWGTLQKEIRLRKVALKTKKEDT